MQKNSLQIAIERMNAKVFLSLLFVYQIIFIFQGLDFADEGFYATFYQQIFHDPQSVMFNFMYWLTGIVGGAFHCTFPQLGLLGIRLLGVIVTTSTIILAYNLLKKYLNIYHLRLGLLLTTIIISNDPKELNYDNLSMLLFVLSVVFLFKGLQENKLSKLLISGAFLGLNVFTRVTNILGLVLVLAIIYNGYINRHTLIYQIKQILFFISGFFLIIIAILLLMKLINHYALFVSSLNIVLNMGTDQESGHSIKHVLFRLFNKYFLSISYVVIFFISIAMASLVKNILYAKTKYNWKILFTALKYCFFLSVCILTFIGKIKWNTLLLFFVGLSFTASLLIIVSTENKNIKLLVVIGTLILLFYPMGSEEFVEMFSLWIVFPIAIDYFFNIKSIDNTISVSSAKSEQSISLFINELQTNEIKKYFVYTCIFIGLFYAYFYPYFDISNRANMHYSIENKFLKGIYTTKERANAVNELLNVSSKYVKKDDYVLAYDCIPMVHYLTETKPFMYNSWPWAYLPEAFKNELYISLQESKKLPVVIMQKVNTLNSNWPENINDNYSNIKKNLARNTCMNDFLKNNNYRKVWENKAFEILIPDKLPIDAKKN